MSGASLSAVALAYLHAEQRSDDAVANALTATDRRNCPKPTSRPTSRYELIMVALPGSGERFSLLIRRERARWRVEPRVPTEGGTENAGSELYVVRDAGQYRVC
jgi:hypothetical protein